MISENAKSVLAIILSIMIWSASFVATKIAYQAFTPLFLCLVRFTLAAVFMTIVRMLRQEQKPLSARDRKGVILSALCGITIYYAFENLGLLITSAGNASVITAVYPVFSILIGYFFFHDRIPARQLCGILLAIMGIIIVNFGPMDFSGRRTLLGNCLLIFNGFMWGLYNYLTHGITKDTDTATLTYYQTVYGSLLFLPVLFIEPPVLHGPLTGSVILALLFLTSGCSMLAYYLYNFGIRRVSVGMTLSLMNLMPIFGLIFSALILHETISLSQIAGAAAVIFGVAISAYSA